MLMVARTGNSSAMTAPTNSTLSATNYLSNAYKMNVPQNLLNPIDSWSKHDVQKWIEYCIDEYSLGDVHLNDFEMNGKALLLLTEDNFKQRSPRSGDILHKALQQHRGTLKALHCQTFPFPLWNNFAFPSIPSSTTPTRSLDVSSSSSFSLPISPYHPATTGVLPHSSASSLHPAFNCSFNRSETMTKSSSTLNHRTNHLNSSSPSSTTRHREMSASSASSTSSLHANDLSIGKKSRKSDSYDVKREAISPSLQQQQQHSNRQPTPTSSPAMTTIISPPIKQEYADEEEEEEEVDIERSDTVPTPPITSSSPSSSPQSSSSVLSKLNQLNNEALPFKIRSQLLSRIKHQPNDVTNTTEKQINADANNMSNDTTRQIRYYHDRIDFRGDILYKPAAAKNCRILWEFLYILLEDPQYQSIIHWEDRDKMVFRIIQADKLAALWGLQKNRLSMTYEKLSRGMRYYYSNNIISKEQSKRLLYRFMRSPEEIRRSMKRNGGNTSMVYSATQKRSSPSYAPHINGQSQDMNEKSNLDNEDHSRSSSSSSSHFNRQSPSDMQNQLLQFFSICAPSTTPSILPNLDSTSALLLAATNASASQASSASPLETKTNPSLVSICKSDRSNSSSPESFDSSRDRVTDSEKQPSNSSQHLTSSSSSSSSSSSTGVSSSTTSAKRKQSIPMSLTARLSNQHQLHHSDQPLNLAVHKEEHHLTDSKKMKHCSSPSND